MPNTTNILLNIPTHGSFVDTWDQPNNGDFTSLDGFLAGVQVVNAAGASPITLTKPTGSVTPVGGPTQAENAVLRFTGILTGNVQVTLPLPGYMIIENLTTGNFVLSFRAIGSGEVIGIDQGSIQHIYNDGTNVRFVNLGRRGTMEFWAGLTAMPAWVGACTVLPYLPATGGVYSFSQAPYLGARLGSSFGGNGSTSFGVPDMQGRVPLAYDGTGTRITPGGSGLNGQSLGAALDQQTVTLSLSTIPTGISSSVSVVSPNSTFLTAPSTGFGIASFSAAPGTPQVWRAFDPGAGLIQVTNITSTGAGTSVNTSGLPHNNVQPSQVAGIWVIKT